jgi:hypothetical protein
MTTSKPRPVVVTTAHRGVFFGNTTDPDDTKIITLTDAQMCVSWSSSIKGVLGLAATGPDRSCRVGPAVPAITLQDVIAVMGTTDEAVKAWQAQPWS